MKNIPKLLLCFLAFSLLYVGEAQAQSPEAFKYQAVVRNPNNTPVIEQAVGIRISILQGLDILVYQEAHAPTTSAIGLIALNIGEGTPLYNAFPDIAWESGDHFLQVEVDISGGTSYQLLGTSQLLSVPYALFAKQAGGFDLEAGEGISIDGNRIENTRPGLWQLEGDLVTLIPGNVPVNVAEIVGVEGLNLAGNPARTGDVIIANNGRVTFAEEVGINQTFSFVDLNVRNQPGNGTVFQVEDTTGTDLFEIGRNGNVGINQITNNVTLQVQNKSVGDNNIIANFERANGDNVLQIQQDRDVVITGDLNVTGSKNFVLDHPLDPANKTLSHNAVESPDRVTYYDGTVRLNESGEAVVELPGYFQALNSHYNYQLTCVGGFAQVYISKEISNNQFTIAGGNAGMKVSWQVSARRSDPWAASHPYQAEEEKEPQDKGKYYYPEGYGKGDAAKIGMDDSTGPEPKEEDQ